MAGSRGAQRSQAAKRAEVEAAGGDWQEPKAGHYWNGAAWIPLDGVLDEAEPVPTPDMTRAERKALGKAYRAAEEQRLKVELALKGEEAAQALPAKIGRPSIYTEELGLEICERLASGQSLSSICDLDHMPHISVIYDWIKKDSLFAERYGHAREQMAHTLFDECLVIADDTANDLLVAEDGTVTANTIAVTRAKLKIDTRMRMAGKMSPKVFSERVETLGLGAGSTVNVQVNAMTIDARTLDSDQRDSLRRLLLEAQSNIIDV